MLIEDSGMYIIVYLFMDLFIHSCIQYIIRKELQLIMGSWKLILVSFNIYLVVNYEIDKFMVDYAYALFKSLSTNYKPFF